MKVENCSIGVENGVLRASPAYSMINQDRGDSAVIFDDYLFLFHALGLRLSFSRYIVVS